jgi:phosphate transport system substrate-binding protein
MLASLEFSMSQIAFPRVTLFVTAFVAIATVHGQEKTIKIDGSSTVYPVSAGIAEEFYKQKGDQVKVHVQFSGTTAGFRKFLNNETDIQDASRPINKEEIAQAKANGIEYIELPICFDALTIAVNPKNDWVDSIRVSELKKLWEPEAQGKITKWNQIRPAWPDAAINLFGAGRDSGTYDYFTEVIVGKTRSSRSDYNASEDDNDLVKGIESDRYALGFIPYAYYYAQDDHLKALAVEWDVDPHAAREINAKPVMPSPAAVLRGYYTPLGRPLFIYVSKKSLERSEVRQFVEFYIRACADVVKKVDYLSLSDIAYRQDLRRLSEDVTGTAFAGESPVAVSIQDILTRKPLP